MIQEKFNHYKNTPSDINMHLDTLLKYGKECTHITEMGVRDVVSTWAWLLAKPKKLRCYDIHRSRNIDSALYEAQLSGIDMEFYESDVLKIEIEPTELIFIDTLHTFTQLSKELALHASKVSKYIIFHDTETYGFKPEPSSWQSPEIMKNYVKNDRGIMPAISEFLAKNKDWKIAYQVKYNNGLTIIERG